MEQQLPQPIILFAIIRDQRNNPEIITSYTSLHQAIIEAIRAVAMQEQSHASPPRIAIHTALPTKSAIAHIDLERDTCKRLCALAAEGQILVTGAAMAALPTMAGEREGFRSLGPHRLSNLSRAIEVYQVLHPSLRDDFPVLRSLNSFAHNLPLIERPFIGRTPEQADVRRLLADSPLVTLLGTGGSGKTRLALQVAANQIADYQDGVWFVDLTLQTETGDVALAIAEALQILGEPGLSIPDLLSAYLQDKRLLLVLDNCEHLIDSCATVIGQLLAICPGLTVLATSRERLELASERILQLPPLAVPIEAGASLERMLHYESVQLFVERAQRVRDFQLTEDHAASIASICIRLDGIPLALELAASQVRYHSIAEVAHQLGKFLDMASGSRSAPARHRTMRAALDWSYSQLTSTAQEFWRCLSVAASGFSLGLIEQIWRAADRWGESAQEMLAQMVDKSLVIVRDGHSQTRYQMLEPIRQYGREKLSEAGEEPQVFEHLLHWALQYTQTLETALQGSSFVEATKYVEQEYENLKAALAWAVEAGAVELGLRLALNLFWYWYYHQHFQRSQQEQNWLTVFTNRYDGPDARLRAKALYAEGMMADSQGNPSRAVALLESAVELWTNQGDDRGLGDALTMLGSCYAKQNDWSRAEQIYAQAAAVLQRSGDRLGKARYLWNLGAFSYNQGHYDKASEECRESLALMKELGQLTGMSALIYNLGIIAHGREENEMAQQHLENRLQLERELKRDWGVAHALLALVTFHTRMTHYRHASEYAVECLAFTERMGDPSQITRTFMSIAHLLDRLQLVEEAVSLLLGIAGYMDERSVIPDLKEEYHSLLHTLRDRCDEKAMARLFAAKRPTLHELVLSAQSALHSVLAQREKPVVPAAQNSGLSKREEEVVQAVVDGLHRRDIARKLVISERTVDNHLSNIASKLGFGSNRMRELMTWAMQNGFTRKPPTR